MSTLTSDPPFARGQTLGGGVATLDSTFGLDKVGCRKEFLDIDAATGVMNSNRTVTCICLKNTSGAALTKSKLVKFSAVGSASAVAAAADYQVAVVDEYLPSGGVAVNDLFWGVIRGPTTVAASGAISAGGRIAVSTLGNCAAGTGAVAYLGEAIAAAANSFVRAIVGGTDNSASIPTNAA
jgi:hypothetical protein